MGIIRKNSALGNIRGGVGGIVLKGWRKLQVVSSRPAKSLKKGEKKSEELSPQSKRLTLVTKLLSQFTTELKVGFYSKNSDLPAFQTAVQFAVNHALTEIDSVYAVDYEKLIFSKGRLDIPWSTSLMALGEGIVRLTWEVPPTSKIKLTGNDKAQVIIYSKTHDRKVGIPRRPPSERRLLGMEMRLSNYYLGDELHFWMFFAKPDGTDVSDTEYLGSLTLN